MSCFAASCSTPCRVPTGRRGGRAPCTGPASGSGEATRLEAAASIAGSLLHATKGTTIRSTTTERARAWPRARTNEDPEDGVAVPKDTPRQMPTRQGGWRPRQQLLPWPPSIAARWRMRGHSRTRGPQARCQWAAGPLADLSLAIVSAPTASRATRTHARSTTLARLANKPFLGQARAWSPKGSTTPPHPGLGPHYPGQRQP